MGTDFLALIATFLGSREFAIAVTALVIIGGLSLLIALHLDGSRRVRAPLERLRADLAAIGAKDPAPARLEAADRAFAATPFADVWRGYRSTVELESDGQARNYGDPHAFFAPDGPLAGRLPARRAGLAEAVLAASLFGTLLAVIGSALTANGGGLGGPINLLPAFAGLLVYAIMILVARAQVAGDRQAAIGIAGLLQRLSTHVPAETVLRRQLRAAELYEDQLQRLRGDLSTAIGSQIDAVLVARTEKLPDMIGSRIGESVGDKLAPITAEMAETRAALARTGAEMAAKAGDTFLQIWRSSAEAQLTSMTAALGTSTAAVERQVAALSDAEHRFVDSLDRSATRLTDAADRFEAVLDGGAESITSRLKPLEGLLGALPASIAASADGALQTIAQGLGRTVESLHDSTRGFGETATAELDGRIKALSSLLQSAAGEVASAAAAASEDLRRSGSALTASAADGARQIAEAAAATGNQFGEQSRAMTIGLDRAVAALASVTEAITVGERTFGSGLERATGQLLESAATFRKNFESSNQSMTARLQEFDAVLARGPDTISRTAVAAIDTITTAIEASAKSIQSATDGYAEHATRTVSERIESFTAALEAATAHLSDSATTFRESFEAGNASMASRLQALDAVLARGPDTITRTAVSAVDAITGAIEASAKSIQSATDGYAEHATRTLSDRIESFAAALEAATAHLSDSATTFRQSFEAGNASMATRLQELDAVLARGPDTITRTAVSAVDTITGAIAASARAIQTTTDGYAENATKVLDQRVRSLAETLDRAGASLLKSSSDAGHEITQAVGEFGAQIDRLSSRLEIASADLARQPDRMSDAFGTVWKNAAVIQLESLTTSLRGSIDAMDAVTKTVQEVDRNLGTGLGKAAAKLDEASQRLDSLMIHRNATIADQLDALDQVLARLPAAIAETTEGAMKDIRSGLTGTVDELHHASKTFTAGATAEIEAKVRALADLMRKAGDEILVAARESGETLRKSGDTLTEGIAGGVKVIADTAQTASSHLSDAVGQLEGQIDKLATRLDHAAGGLAHQTGEMARAGEAISTTSAALSRMATAVEAAADPLTASVHSARDALTYVARGLATITAATEQGKNATDAITRSTDAARQFFDAQNTRITELDRVITSTLVQLRDSMKRLSTEISTEIRIIANINREEVQGFLQEMDQKLRYLDKNGR